MESSETVTGDDPNLYVARDVRARDFSFLRYACRRHVARGEEKRGEERAPELIDAAWRCPAETHLSTARRCIVTCMRRFRRKRERPGYVYPMIQRTRPIVSCTRCPEFASGSSERWTGASSRRTNVTRNRPSVYFAHSNVVYATPWTSKNRPRPRRIISNSPLN